MLGCSASSRFLLRRIMLTVWGSGSAISGPHDNGGRWITPLERRSRVADVRAFSFQPLLRSLMNGLGQGMHLPLAVAARFLERVVSCLAATSTSLYDNEPVYLSYGDVKPTQSESARCHRSLIWQNRGLQTVLVETYSSCQMFGDDLMLQEKWIRKDGWLVPLSRHG